MTFFGYACEAAGWAVFLVIVAVLAYNKLHGLGYGITVVCPNCGDSGEYCPECLGAGWVEDDGVTDREFDRSVDWRNGVA
jgi:hypothetical protein